MHIAGMLVLLWLAAALQASPLEAQLRGRVSDNRTGESVAGAVVRLAPERGTAATQQITSTDGRGAYLFDRIAGGGYCIHVHHPGYEAVSVCIRIAPGGSLTVDLPVSVRPVQVSAITVAGERAAGAGSSDASPADSVARRIMQQRLAAPGPQGSAALASAVLNDLMRDPPPDDQGSRRPHALYIWGSSAERGRVLIDGASVNAPLHLGALLPPLDPDVLSAAAVRSGGISPRYDGGTTHIMEFTTRAAADRPRVWGEFDLLAARLGVETPVNGRGRVIASARRINDEVIDGLSTRRFGYGYADVLARADLSFGDAGALHGTVLATNESVRIPRDLGEDEAAWDNRAATLAWRRTTDAARSDVTVSLSRGVADLPLLTARGGHLEASVDRASAAAERHWNAGGAAWGVGAEVEHLRFGRTARAEADPVTGVQDGVGCSQLLPCASTTASLAALYAEASVQPAAGISGTLGVRGSYHLDDGRLYLLPRASVSALLGASSMLTLSAGRFSQAFVRETGPGHQQISAAIAQATHVELNLVRHSPRALLTSSAYIRRHDAVAGIADARVTPGLDLSAGWHSTAGTVTLGYSISGGAPAERAGSTPVQQLAALGLAREYGRWRIGLSAAYGSGLPLTAVVLEQPTASDSWQQQQAVTLQSGNTRQSAAARRDYFRVEASLAAVWDIGVGGRTVQLMPYARVLNALTQREALFYYREAGPGGTPQPLAGLPAVPIIGVRINTGF